ncbi:MULTISPECIES: sugar phosphate isomerase/epimerase family protein [unclassified Paenibacillus]|uniref:sugar phosphate isomerase/epimerase family protein n=1 Tax=unclassified Paenibacillus TaxID=185978 RepID=UPI0036418298
MNQRSGLIVDGSSKPPRIEVHQSWWAMNGIGSGGKEWSMEEKFEKIAEAGFTGIMAHLPKEQEAESWRRLLDEYSFNFGIHSFPRKPEDMTQLLKEAKQFGVLYVNSQVMDSFVIGQQAIDLLQGLVEEAQSADIPYTVETHRGRVTQDLHRTVDYVKAIPDLRLTIDLSHYIVAGELTAAASRELELAGELFNVLLQRTSSIHARISNGEQVQVDIGPNAEHGMVEPFMKWWQQGMSYWLAEAKPGAVLPFVTELGPPDYAITETQYVSGERVEISDRWEQALVLKRLGEEAWKRAIESRKSL